MSALLEMCVIAIIPLAFRGYGFVLYRQLQNSAFIPNYAFHEIFIPAIALPQ
jgi:hypothetical protein